MARFFEQVKGVYFDDLDPFHILHNARYLVLFERTLGAFWHELGAASFNDAQYPDRFHLVRANHIVYDTPVTGVGQVRVRVWVDHVGNTSMTFGFKVMPMHEDTVHAHGKRTVVCVDPETRTPRPWSEDFRATIAPWLATA